MVSSLAYPNLLGIKDLVVVVVIVTMLEVTHGEDACYICYINALLPAHFGPCYFLMLNIMMCSSPHVRENV
jgi:hypothetical protein